MTPRSLQNVQNSEKTTKTDEARVRPENQIDSGKTTKELTKSAHGEAQKLPKRVAKLNEKQTKKNQGETREQAQKGKTCAENRV